MHRSLMDQSPESIKIAYIILAHKLPSQLTRLVRKLSGPGTSFFIHVDKRTAHGIYQEMVESLRTSENVHFLKRHACHWGGFNVVGATLEGIRAILAMEQACDYVILLSGQDYPIKSNLQIRRTLHERNGRSYLEYFPLPAERWQGENGGLDRLQHWHFNVFGQPIALLRRGRFMNRRLGGLWKVLTRLLPIQRTIPGHFELYGGSAYWCLTKDAIDYIDEFVQRRPDFVGFFRHVHVPDELFFQIVLLNSPFAGHLVADNLRYIVWSDSPHPEILRETDLDRLLNSTKLFARKFDVSIDARVLDSIDGATA